VSNCSARIGWACQVDIWRGGRIAQDAQFRIQYVLRMSYVSMARGDEEGSAWMVKTSALRACNVLELCLTKCSFRLQY